MSAAPATTAEPATPAGSVARISLADTTFTSRAGVPPTLRLTPVRKCAPLMTIEIPPVVGPLEGVTELMTGTATM